MLKKVLFVIAVFLFISCGDSGSNGKEEDKKCVPDCSEWQTCDVDICKLSEGRCESNENCSEAKPVCNTATHLCEEEIIQNCTENETKCENDNLLTCLNNDWNTVNCATQNKTCKTENNISSCAEKVEEELTIPQVKALTESKTVTTNGIVTDIILYESKVAGLYIQSSQEANGAIFVMIQNGITLNVKEGDTVKVTGFAWNRFGVNRIGDTTNIPVVQVTDSTTQIPQPKEVTFETFTLGEVDMLLEEKDAPFTVIELGESSPYFTKLEDVYGNEIIISSKLYRFNENGLKAGSVISELKGIGASYQDADDLTLFTFMVQPRYASDIIFSNDGTEGSSCRTAEPFCNEGLICNESDICEIKLPCNDSCTENQYCDVESDLCVDLTKMSVAQVRALTEPTYVWTEGVVSKVERKNPTTANIFFQDGSTPYSGLQIYYKNAPVPSLSVGDKIKVTGLAHDYQGFIEIGSDVEQPTIEVLESGVEIEYKEINNSQVNAENLYILVSMLNPPFTATRVDGYYTTVKDSLNNTFIIKTDWIGEYLLVGDVFSTIQGVVYYRKVGDVITFNVNPRNLDEILLAE